MVEDSYFARRITTCETILPLTYLRFLPVFLVVCQRAPMSVHRAHPTLSKVVQSHFGIPAQRRLHKDVQQSPQDVAMRQLCCRGKLFCFVDHAG